MKCYRSVFVGFSLLFASLLYADITTEEISYQSTEDELVGYLAYPSVSSTKVPAVIVVHEWWGHNAYARKRAEMLAELGYVAFALDMYGEGKVAEHPDDARKYMQEALDNGDALLNRFHAALEFVQQQSNVNQGNIAAIGYCFGGGVVLGVARAGMNLNGVVSFHGSLATQMPAKKDAVSAKVLVFHGDNDAFIPAQQVAAFEQEMQAANVDYQLVRYEAVEHSFTNPEADDLADKYNMPLSYDEEADMDSWQKMQSFLKEIFSK